ncbi:hypothetical protein STANM309S_05499 [Streptomyces tanashiensis]
MRVETAPYEIVRTAITAATPKPRRGVRAAMTSPMPPKSSQSRATETSPWPNILVCSAKSILARSEPIQRISSGEAVRTKSAKVIAPNLART